MISGVIPITGYEHMVVEGANALVAKSIASAVGDILKTETLYQYAARAPDALRFEGRAPVYAIPLGLSQERVVVRHAVRGGLVGKLVRDHFVAPTRAARELAAAFRLKLGGVSTPEVLAVVTYPAGPMLRRADVATRYIEDGADLAGIFGDARNDEQRRPILDAVAQLLTSLTGAGAQHPDLNLKNILVTSTEQGYVAHVLDVDRVNFHVPGDPMLARANLDRLVRSLRKWRELTGTRRGSVSDGDISYLSLAAAASPA
ncbi:MAG: lipopolysaccharide kinase InaA family protein [Gemmatimonadaceae bacterium]